MQKQLADGRVFVSTGERDWDRAARYRAQLNVDVEETARPLRRAIAISALRRRWKPYALPVIGAAGAPLDGRPGAAGALLHRQRWRDANRTQSGGKAVGTARGDAPKGQAPESGGNGLQDRRLRPLGHPRRLGTEFPGIESGLEQLGPPGVFRWRLTWGCSNLGGHCMGRCP